jgi:glucosyl-dolichyl phosphate glucuronosyltransferase
MTWSIVICTHNRASNLKEALEKLRNLDYPQDKYEIIVVDNGSTDNTAEVAAEAVRRDAIIYVKEEKLGLSYARNRGIETAKGEFIAFVDDDAWPEPEWLHKLDESFSGPQTACVGGKVVPVLQNHTTWPQWLHKRHLCFFTVIDYADRRKLHYAAYPLGTNIAFRKSVFVSIGCFNPELGRTGTSLLSMEEIEFCYRIERAGYDIWYNPDAIVHHKVHEERLTKDWVKQRAYWEGISAAVLERKNFTTAQIFLKYLKYFIFILGGTTGEIISNVLGNEKLAFFCACQNILCKAYLRKSWALMRLQVTK